MHFSPVIIDTELAHIKSPEGLEELNAENLVVKVASAVNEVTVAYNVDEHQLELTLKIPNDWPLQRVTIKDSKRIAVPENRWRGWLLGVQQIVWSQACILMAWIVPSVVAHNVSQNGHIVDAISLFKKNVSLHFEGQTECAICYSYVLRCTFFCESGRVDPYPSIISVTDGSLPRKACKTCKNRFHASCLYKVCTIVTPNDYASAQAYNSGSTQVILQVVPYVARNSCSKLAEPEVSLNP